MRGSRARSILRVVVTVVAAACPAAADMTVLSDARSVYAEAGYWVDASWGSDSYSPYDSATATAPFFDQMVHLDSSWTAPDGLLVGLGEGSQTSTIGAAWIVASGGAVGVGDTYSGGGGDPMDPASSWWEDSEASGRGRSTLDVVFSVSVVTPYTLTGSMTANGGGFRILLEALGGGASDPFDLVHFADSVLAESGLLQPGTYRLFAEADADATFVGGTATVGYDFLLTVPEPATGVLVGIGLVGLGGWRRRRDRGLARAADDPAASGSSGSSKTK